MVDDTGFQERFYKVLNTNKRRRDLAVVASCYELLEHARDERLRVERDPRRREMDVVRQLQWARLVWDSAAFMRGDCSVQIHRLCGPDPFDRQGAVGRGRPPGAGAGRRPRPSSPRAG